jgi:flavin reductase (DIM6/NTAB) family NADH-FMN oxidoreductase RutF
MQTTDPHKSLGAALGRIPSGLFILTASADGIETGMLASWVQQCSFQPPLITFAVQPGRPFATLLAEGFPFTVNILEAAQTDMIAHFGKGFGLGERAFDRIEIERSLPYGPILAEALGHLHARVVSRRSAGDHDLFVAEAAAGALHDEGQPMVHVRKNGFHY